VVEVSEFRKGAHAHIKVRAEDENFRYADEEHIRSVLPGLISGRL
jgi:hypothetical protein